MRAAFVLLALVLLVVAFVAEAPATLLDRRVQEATRGAVRLADARGTVWSGRAMLADAQGRWRVPLAWRAAPAGVLAGRVDVSLVPQAPGEPRGSVAIAEQDLAVSDLDLRLPAAVVESAWQRAPAPRFDGTLLITSPAFRRTGARVDGSLDARWENARVTFAGMALALGTLQAEARPADGATRVKLRNRGGDVALDGELRVQDDAVQLDLHLTPAATLAPPLALLVRSLGAVEADGRVHVTWQAKR